MHALKQGVSWDQKRQKWRASLKTNGGGKARLLGYFEQEAEAVQAYVDALPAGSPSSEHVGVCWNRCVYK